MRLGIDLSELGGEVLTYRRLAVILANSPSDSAYQRSVAGEDADWTLTDHLLATIADLTAAANWQRGGGKGRRPKPIPRPGLEDKATKQIGGNRLMTIEEARQWVRKRRGGDGRANRD